MSSPASRPHTLVALLALLLGTFGPASPRALGADPPKAKTTAKDGARPHRKAKVTVLEDGVLLLIWGGGKKPEDAAKAIDAFQKLRVETTVAPVKLDSSTVKGLNPGFFVAALGACPIGQGRAVLQRLRLVSDGVYARYVPREGEVKALACPKVKLPRGTWFFEPQGDGEPHQLTDTLSAKAGAGTLRGKLTVEIASNGETMHASYGLEAVLVDAKGTEVAAGKISPSGSFARVERFEVEGAELHLEVMEAARDCGVDTFFESEDVEYRVRVRQGKIDVVREVISRESGLCEPSNEGLDPCQFGKKMARFQALQATCKNATRADCMAADSAYEEDDLDCEAVGAGAE